MVDQKLMDNLNRLGFPLMEVQAEVDANKTLAEVLYSIVSRALLLSFLRPKSACTL
jgi:hypothetical protein